MSQAMLEALSTKLGTLTSLSSAVGGRMYQDQPPQNVDLPYLVFTALPGIPTRYLTGQKKLTLRVQFDLYGKRGSGQEALGDIEELLYDGLEGVSITPTGFDRGVCTFLSRGGREIEEDAIRIIDEIQIEGTEP